MGTRGYQVIRYRKRYYATYNQYDTYPEGLGKSLVSSIPKDPAQYAKWLEDQRHWAAKTEAECEECLTLKLEDGGYRLSESEDDNGPTWLVPLNDTWIEWVYVIDLDREVFSVNNGAHFKLNEIAKIVWMQALADGALGDKLVLPGLVPEEALANLVTRPSVAERDAFAGLETLGAEQYQTLPRHVVTPNNIDSIPWRRRHGPLLRSIMFWVWSSSMEDKLAANLLQWSTNDLPFREIAFAALCLALGGKHITVMSKHDFRFNGTLGLVEKRHHEAVDAHFLRGLTTGAHLEGGPLGSAPEQVVYWLDNVLVVLATQLYRPDAVQEGVSFVEKYCAKHLPNNVVDAVLVSIEHVVLVHVVPYKEVQHTSVLPLFEIKNHLTMYATDRYSKSYFDKLISKDEAFMKKEQKRQRKAMQESMLKNEGVNMQWGSSDGEEDEDEEEEDYALHKSQVGVEGDTSSTFYALVHLFDAAARRRMSPSKPRDGRLPNEIYEQILHNVTDRTTRFSCMQVSRYFRELCQENLLYANGLMLEPCTAVEECVQPDLIPSHFNQYDIDNDTEAKVRFQKAGGFMDLGFEDCWFVAVGTGRDTKSVLTGLEFQLRETE